MSRQQFQYHPASGYTFIPGLKARIDHEAGGYLVQVNASGFRCKHDFDKPKEKDRFRILLFGDSYTAGDGVSNKYRYGDRLEGLLPNVDVFNFGLPGSGTDQHYLLFHELTKEMSYDLVVIAVLVENIRRVNSRYRPYASEDGSHRFMAKPYFSLDPQGELQLHHSPAPPDPVALQDLPEEEARFVDQGGDRVILRKLINKLGPRVKELAQKATQYQPVPGYDQADNPDWLLMKAILQRWISEVGTPIILFPIPLYQFVEETSSPTAYQNRFAELHAPPHVQVHDPLPHLQTFTKEQRRGFRFEKDVHPTPEMHDALANALATAVRPFLKST